MRDLFRGYYQPTDEEFRQLWNGGEIVLDTNVILNLYRYSLATRQQLIDVLEKSRDRLWLPHQVASEYHRRRVSVMVGEKAVYRRIQDSMSDGCKRLLNDLDTYARHPVLDLAALKKRVETAFSKLAAYIEEQSALHPDLPEGSAPGANDAVRDMLTKLYADRVGSPYSAEDLEKICQEADLRFEQEMPPGYLDAGKSDNPYGDYIIWRQILDHAKSVQRPVIFVTDDRKDDWWSSVSGQTIGPRPELVMEIWEKAGVLFHMYRPFQFISQAQASTDVELSDEAVEEVRNVSDSQSLMKAKLLEYRDELAQQLSLVQRRKSRATALRRELESQTSHVHTDRSLVEIRRIAVEIETEITSISRRIDRAMQELASSDDLVNPSAEDLQRHDLLADQVKDLLRRRSELSNQLKDLKPLARSSAAHRPDSKNSARRMRELEQLHIQELSLAEKLSEIDIALSEEG